MMAGKRKAEAEFDYRTRRELATLFRVPLRLLDRWIATGKVRELRASVFGRGGQRAFYSATDVEKMTLVKRTRKSKPGTPTRRKSE
jgi:hypothetical protein